jgi:hypothetical protein
MKTSLIIFGFWIAGIIWGALIFSGQIPVIANILISFGVGYLVGYAGEKLEERQ